MTSRENFEAWLNADCNAQNSKLLKVAMKIKREVVVFLAGWEKRAMVYTMKAKL